MGAREFLCKPLDANDLTGQLRGLMRPTTVSDRRLSRTSAAGNGSAPSVPSAVARTSSPSGSTELAIARSGTPRVFDQLVGRLITSLRQAVRRTFPRASEHVLDTAAETRFWSISETAIVRSFTWGSARPFLAAACQNGMPPMRLPAIRVAIYGGSDTPISCVRAVGPLGWKKSSSIAIATRPAHSIARSGCGQAYGRPRRGSLVVPSQ